MNLPESGEQKLRLNGYPISRKKAGVERMLQLIDIDWPWSGASPQR